MNVSVNERYLSILLENIINIDVIVTIFSILEFLPLFYHSISSAYFFTNQTTPLFLKDNVSVISYIYQFEKIYSNKSLNSYLIVIIAVFLFFILYKYVFLTFCKKTNRIINCFIINLYEIVIFRQSSFIIVDIEIKAILEDNFNLSSVLGCVLFCSTCYIIFYHFQSTMIYLNQSPIKLFSFDNQIMLFKDMNSFLMKILLCIEINEEKSSTISYFMAFMILFFNSSLYIYQATLIIYSPFSFFDSHCNTFFYFFANGIIVGVEISIIFIEINSLEFFFYILFGNTIISILILLTLLNISSNKILDENNQLGRILLLLNQTNKKASFELASKIVNSHKCNCRNINCKFCLKISKSKEKSNKSYSDRVASLIFRYLLGKQLKQYGNDIQFRRYYHLIELHLCLLSNQNNLVTVLLVYNKIKTSIKNNFLSTRNEAASINFSSQNFILNLDYMLTKIIQKLATNEKYHENAYILNVDSFCGSVKAFIEYLMKFIDTELYGPKEIIKLASNMNKLKEKVNFKVLSLKENRDNYSCVLTGFIIEELFNDQMSTSIYFHDLICSYEESLNLQFKKNNIILLKYNIVQKTLLIKQCGAALIHYKNRGIEEMFPPFLKYIGKQKLINYLSSNKAESFDFYYHSLKHHIGEKIKMKFSGLPSTDLTQSIIYLLGNYLIEPGILLFFQKNMNPSMNKKKVLILTSGAISFLSGIPTEELNKIITTSTITKKDLIIKQEESMKCLSFKKLKKPKERKSSLKIVCNKPLSVEGKEKIGNFYIYSFRGKNDNQNYIDKRLTNPLNSKFNCLTESVIETKISFNYHPQDLGFEFIRGETGGSSSNVSQASSLVNNQMVLAIKKEQKVKFRKFTKFSYSILMFNLFIISLIFVFLIVQLFNNNRISTIFTIVKSYDDFQNSFYLTSLSIFSLACYADSVESIECTNNYASYSKTFIKNYGLKENQRIDLYLSKQLPINTEIVLQSLKEWEKGQGKIKKENVNKVLQDKLAFATINQVGDSISLSLVSLTLEEAIKQYVNIINTLCSTEEFYNSPIYYITTNAKGKYDLSNILSKKSRTQEGNYLTTVQILSYSIILNFQKFIQRLLAIGQLVHDYIGDILKETSIQIISFLILFIIFHIIMMSISFVFVFEYKKLHMEYYFMILGRLKDKVFTEKILKQKMNYILTFLDLYKEPPSILIQKINLLKKKEVNEKIKELKTALTEHKTKNSIIIPEKIAYIRKENESINFDISEINKLYKKEIYINIVIIVILFTTYEIASLVFLFIINDSIDQLREMNQYTEDSFGITNNIYINIGLCQLMALTNQTDLMLAEYFGINVTSTDERDGFIRNNIEDTIELILKIYKMEKNSKSFHSISDLIDLNCDTVYHSLKDSVIQTMVDLYPENDFYGLLRQYCLSIVSINEYNEDKLIMNIITYQTKNILDMFVNRTYELYSQINYSDLLYSVYTEALIVLRPLRRFLYRTILKDVVQSIINHYILLLVIYLMINFLYESIILLVLKFVIIQRGIQSSKEVLMVAQAFDCF